MTLTTEQHETMIHDYGTAIGGILESIPGSPAQQRSIDDASETEQKLCAEHAALLAEIERLRAILSEVVTEVSEYRDLPLSSVLRDKLLALKLD
jgi:hypothetical protein